MTLQEKIEVIKAFDEGKEIEVYDGYYGKWGNKPNNNFWDFDTIKYRVKPQPTRLDILNNFYKEKFGIDNRFRKSLCVSSFDCSNWPAHTPDNSCDKDTFWTTPYEERNN